MKTDIRAARIAFLAVATALVLTACKPVESERAAARAQQQTPGIPGVAGLDSAQQQSGYAIGLELGSTLIPVRDELDLDAMFDGVRDALEGSEPKLDEQQYMQVMQHLGERMQTRRNEVAQQAGAREQVFLSGNAERAEVQVTASGLQYEVLEAGEGTPPGPDAWVRAHYEGSLIDGEVFDSSIARGEPAEFPLQDLIPGWQEGLQLMAPGARYRFWIPAALGYGEEGAAGGLIGPNATLIFEVELIDVMAADE